MSTEATSDDALAARLAELSNRVPPPTDGLGARNASGARTVGSASRRRHAAQHSRTAALTLSVLTTGGLGYYFAATDHTATASGEAAGIVQGQPPVASSTPSTTTSTNDPTGSATAGNSTSTRNSASTETSTSVAGDPVVVNGETFTNKWGPVQVQATFAPDGSLVAVNATRTPDSRSKSVAINDRAAPRLNSEALTAQNAQVDTVSGATYTSTSYRQSLQSAIDIAVANGIPAGANA